MSQVEHRAERSFAIKGTLVFIPFEPLPCFGAV